MTTLESLRVDVIGLNCSTGPEHMREPIRFLTRARVAPDVVHSERRACRSTPARATRSIRSSREPMAQMLGEFVEQFGVRIVGGCCGTRAGAPRGDRGSMLREA